MRGRRTRHTNQPSNYPDYVGVTTYYVVARPGWYWPIGSLLTKQQYEAYGMKLDYDVFVADGQTLSRKDFPEMYKYMADLATAQGMRRFRRPRRFKIPDFRGRIIVGKHS